jgi:nickel-type superoxide dismutase maturation protease
LSKRQKCSGPSFWDLFVLSTVMSVSATIAARAAMRYRRFAISGASMQPALEPGDWVLVDEKAYRRRLPRRGHIVVAADPRDPARHLVKRVAGVDLHRQVQLAGDNPDESTDSRHFGPVPANTVRGRVRWRYWPPGRVGAVI